MRTKGGKLERERERDFFLASTNRQSRRASRHGAYLREESKKGAGASTMRVAMTLTSVLTREPCSLFVLGRPLENELVLSFVGLRVSISTRLNSICAFANSNSDSDIDIDR